jgi:Domain of unknown function (DUF4386)
MTPLRKTALVAGVFYVLSFISIPTLALYSGLRDPIYIVNPGSGNGAIWGAILEMIVALAGIGTAVVLYPVVRRQGEARALGFAGIRVLEAATIVSGVVVVMSMVSLHQDGAGPQALPIGKVLVAMHNWTFLTGQGFLPAVSAVLLGSLLYQSRLVPRTLPVLGLIGAPLLTISFIATLFGFWTQVSPASGLLTIPIAVWEFALGVYLIVKGFKPSPITTTTPTTDVSPTDRVPVVAGQVG